jgi:phage terminase small subunit
MNRKPPELHLIDGTKSRRDNSFEMPEQVKKRIPKAEWLDNPDAWNKDKFIEETSEFLYTVYGIGNDQDKHTLAVLADQIDLYIKCSKAINKFGVITTFNNGATLGPNPNIPIRNKTISIIIQLMNELGLTPRSRLNAGKVEDNSPVAKFLKGPLAH